MSENSDRSGLLIIDILAGNRGHLIDDDFFLAECLAPLSQDFEVRSSLASIANINKRLNVKTSSIREFTFLCRFPRLRIIFKLLTIPCSRYHDIVFPAFEEVSTLLFMLLHPSKRVHLIYHNNLSSERKDRHPFLWTFFTKMTAAKAASLLVPCQFQANWIKDICPQIDSSKIFFRPVYQIAAPRSRPPLSERSQTIFFMGPPLDRKPIEPLIELIKKDKKHRYKYVLRRMDNIDADTRGFLKTQPNVDLTSGYLGTDEYYRLFSEASWVITTHNLLFEGKLSGIFCDAIAAGTPLITRGMSPHDEFFERFGDMGVLVDYDKPQWAERFLATDFSSKQYDFQQNMGVCRESCTMEAIRDVFRAAFTHCARGYGPHRGG